MKDNQRVMEDNKRLKYYGIGKTVVEALAFYKIWAATATPEELAEYKAIVSQAVQADRPQVDWTRTAEDQPIVLK